MDVVDARADFVGVVEALERSKQLHLATAGLDGDDVRIERRHRLYDEVEVAVAHVGVDLGAVHYRARAQTEGAHRPVEIGLVILFAQGQTFTDRRFVDLDDLDAGGFQVCHLVANGKANLQG